MKEDLQVFLLVAGIAILGCLVGYLRDRKKIKKELSDKAKKYGTETLFLNGFRRNDRVIILKGEYMGCRGKVAGLFVDYSYYRGLNFDYLEVVLDNEQKTRGFWFEFVMKEDEYEDGTLGRGDIKTQSNGIGRVQ